jgi:hypothetical protein
MVLSEPGVVAGASSASPDAATANTDDGTPGGHPKDEHALLPDAFPTTPTTFAAAFDTVASSSATATAAAAATAAFPHVEPGVQYNIVCAARDERASPD